jgi:hypothetical protein
MFKFISAYLPILLIALLLAMIFLAPGWAGAIVSVALILSFAIAILPVVQKQMKLYQKNPASRVRLGLNVLLEIMGILLAMVLAGLLGKYIAQISTAQISNGLTKLIAGIAISLLAGMGMGILVKRTWEKLVKTSA